jgi:hypothetical protein
MLVDGRHFPITRQAASTGSATVQRKGDGKIVLDATNATGNIAVHRLDSDRFNIQIGAQSHAFSRDEMKRLTLRSDPASVAIHGDVDAPVRTQGPDGRERTTQNATPRTSLGPKQGTIKIFGQMGEWSMVGQLGYGAALTMNPSFADIRGTGLSSTLSGGEGWRNTTSFGPSAWSLDVTAQLLSGARRC